jgi:hypothetical protein
MADFETEVEIWDIDFEYEFGALVLEPDNFRSFTVLKNA